GGGGGGGGGGDCGGGWGGARGGAGGGGGDGGVRVPQRQEGGPRRKAAARSLCRSSARRIPALSSRGGASVRPPRGAGRGSGGRAGQILGDARPAVREPGAHAIASGSRLR